MTAMVMWVTSRPQTSVKSPWPWQMLEQTVGNIPRPQGICNDVECKDTPFFTHNLLLKSSRHYVYLFSTLQPTIWPCWSTGWTWELHHALLASVMSSVKSLYPCTKRMSISPKPDAPHGVKETLEQLWALGWSVHLGRSQLEPLTNYEGQCIPPLSSSNPQTHIKSTDAI